MKRCCSCDVEKEETEFNKNKSKKDGLQIQCRDCNKEQSKDYYKRNKKAHVLVAVARAKKIKQRNRERTHNYLLGHPCIDCGERDVVVLDFDHVRGKKFKDISQMISRGYSWEAIVEEIKKCDVRCANDHRRITAKRFRESQVLASAYPAFNG